MAELVRDLSSCLSTARVIAHKLGAKKVGNSNLFRRKCRIVSALWMLLFGYSLTLKIIVFSDPMLSQPPLSLAVTDGKTSLLMDSVFPKKNSPADKQFLKKEKIIFSHTSKPYTTKLNAKKNF